MEASERRRPKTSGAKAINKSCLPLSVSMAEGG